MTGVRPGGVPGGGGQDAVRGGAGMITTGLVCAAVVCGCVAVWFASEAVQTGPYRTLYRVLDLTAAGMGLAGVAAVVGVLVRGVP